MASKAYVASMTVAELTSELKKRGLNCRGKKKTLQNRLEQALYEEENSETSSESNEEATIMAASAVMNQLEGNCDNSSPREESSLIVSIEHSKRVADQSVDDRRAKQSNGDTMQIELETGGPKSENIEPAPDPSIESLSDPASQNSVPPEGEGNLATTPDPAPQGPEPTNELGPVGEASRPIPDPAPENSNEPVPDPVAEEPVTMEESSAPDPPKGSEEHLMPTTSEYTSVIVDVFKTSMVTTPEKGSTPIPSQDGVIISPGSHEMECESEVNSIAVEPPSPMRDEISFAIEDSSQLTDTPSGDTPGDITSSDILPSGDTPSGDIPSGDTPSGDIPSGGIPSGDTPSSDTISTNISSTMEVQGVNDTKVTGTTSLHDVSYPEPSNIDSSLNGSNKVVSSGVESSTIEVDLVVPTVEDDDMSVFSAEAAEAQQFTLSEKPSSLADVAITGSDGAMTGTEEISTSNRKRQGSVTTSDKDVKDSSSKRRRISTSPRRLQERRRRWGSSTSHTPTASQPTISSDTLETIIPEEVKEEVGEALPNMEEEGKEEMKEEEMMEVKEQQQQDEDDIVELEKDASLMDEYEKEWQEKEREKELQRKEIGRARESRQSIEGRHSIVIEDKDKRQRRTPSPPCNPPSRILHIENLKRPFTVVQLKELLQEDGPLIDGGFWTNKIKSHCIAIYTSTDTAEQTRGRLHGMRWPSINPQFLRVDFLTNKQVSNLSEGQLIVDSRSPTPADNKDTSTKDIETEPAKVISPLKVEDKDKAETATVEDKKDTKPVKVLDDLFRKTKATPPIYWLALSEEEVTKKEAERKVREEERERRREERQKEMEALDQERRERERKIREERSKIDRRSRSPRRQSRSRSPRRRR